MVRVVIEPIIMIKQERSGRVRRRRGIWTLNPNRKREPETRDGNRTQTSPGFLCKVTKNLSNFKIFLIDFFYMDIDFFYRINFDF